MDRDFLVTFDFVDAEGKPQPGDIVLRSSQPLSAMQVQAIRQAIVKQMVDTHDFEETHVFFKNIIVLEPEPPKEEPKTVINKVAP